MANSNKKVFYCSSIRKCELNSYLGSLIHTFLKKNGYSLITKSSQSDYIIINTCGVDQTREDMALSLIQYYCNKYLVKKQLIICGCLPEINPSLNQSEDIRKKLILIGPKELYRFNEIFTPQISIEKVANNLIDKKLCNKNGFKEDGYYILISQGCMSNCAYCSIKKAKGDVTSKPLLQVLKEFKAGLKLGFKYFILLGDDCGSYGMDIGIDLAELLNAIGQIKGDYQISIHYFEPHRLEILFPKIKRDIFRKIYALNIPIQSMNQRIIKLMNRKYNLESILFIAKKIKEVSPSIILKTHIIYCYPTETKKEFLNNINHPGLEEYSQVHYYCFSLRKGTSAAKLKYGISRGERKSKIETIKKISCQKNNYFFPYGDKLEVEGLNFGKPLNI